MKLSGSVLATIGGLILEGLATGDRFAASNTGMSAPNGVLCGFGETKWAGHFGKLIKVVPTDKISCEGKWVTWESSMAVIADLKERASASEDIGSADDLLRSYVKDNPCQPFWSRNPFSINIGLLVASPSARS